MPKAIGFIGLGNMGSALVDGMKHDFDGEIFGFDKHPEKIDALGIVSCTDAVDVAEKSEIIFLCVKPKDIISLLDEIKEPVDGKIVVSIAAGIKISMIESILNSRVVRLMPNIPCIVGEMAAGYSLGKDVTSQDEEIFRKLLDNLGLAVKIDEENMPALIGVAGSAPAFLAQFIRASVVAGVDQGLNEKEAFELACQNAVGTGKLLLEKNISPDELINMVSSPNGTTIAGRKVLDERGFDNIIKDAAIAAAKRSREISEDNNKK